MRDPGAEPRPYQRVYAHLRGRIERGELSNAVCLPSQPGAGRRVRRRAAHVRRHRAAAAGWLRLGRARPGTFVTDPRGADTVLVVDDEPACARCWWGIAGFRVLEASNGLEALEVLAKPGQPGLHRPPDADDGRHRAAAARQATLPQHDLHRRQRLPGRSRRALPERCLPDHGDPQAVPRRAGPARAGVAARDRRRRLPSI